MHGVRRTDDRCLELLGECLLTVILLRILFLLQLQQFLDMLMHVACLRKHIGFLHEVE